MDALQMDSSADSLNKEEIVAVIRRELASVIASRQVAKNDPTLHAARLALRSFQAERMARTHADLLNNPGTGAAAQFFLTDLYSADDLSQRDANLERVVPAMERMLPVPALAAVAGAVSLDALSEKLDAGMARRLGDTFTEQDYIDSYRVVGTRAEREQQIDHVESLGKSLSDLVRVPLIGTTLSMMRGPAKLANLGDLQNFLERGFKAFKTMKRPGDFVDTVVQREREILRRLYAGAADPFLVEGEST